MINSTSNKQVKRVVNLQAKAKARREEGVYVAEGLRMCREFTPKDVEALYVTPSFESQKENREWLHSYSYEIVTEEVMKPWRIQRRLRVCWRWQGRRNTPWRSF